MDSEEEACHIGSLYIGNLHPDVTEGVLYQMFCKMGPILSLRICRDKVTLKSLGYAYVNFLNKIDAERAMYALNFSELNNRSIRIMWTQRDPSLRKSAVGNIFVRNLGPNIGDCAFFNLFSAQGKIVSSKVAMDEKKRSRGYGFVQYECEDSARAAIEKLDGMLLDGRKISVVPFMPRSERVKGEPKPTNLYVKNLSSNDDDDKLLAMFEPFGKITSAKVMLDEDGKSRCFGFVCFESPEGAAKAEAEMNGKWVNGKCLYVAVAQSKHSREKKLKQQLNQIARQPYGSVSEDKSQFTNLFIKNVPKSMSEADVEEMFEKYGTVTSVKVATDENGDSKGYGFVSFLEPEGALRAVQEKNGILIDDKILYVGRALKKCERDLLKSQIDKRV